jgi:hypothetical protein
VSWWGERPWWLRHLVYWAVALGAISLTAFNETAGAVPVYSSPPWLFVVFGFVFIIEAIVGLVFLYREWWQLSPVRTLSRSLVLFTFVLGTLAALLFFARRWGVHIEACHTVRETETCQGQASPQQVLGMLAWHAADLVPVLDIPHSLEWSRPARSAHVVVGVSIITVRLWVAIGILAVLKRLWDNRQGGTRVDESPD